MDTFFQLASNSLKECSTQLQPLLQKLGVATGSRKQKVFMEPHGEFAMPSKEDVSE